jgi:hypothetical protein
MTITIRGRRLDLRYPENVLLLERLQQKFAQAAQQSSPTRNLPAKVARHTIARARLA